MVVHRFEVYLVNLDPTIGSEIRKTRPCTIIDQKRLVKKLGRLDASTAALVLAKLQELFAA